MKFTLRFFFLSVYILPYVIVIILKYFIIKKWCWLVVLVTLWALALVPKACAVMDMLYYVIKARENRKNSRSGPKLRILDRFQTPQNANKSVQHFPNQPIFTNQ